MEPADLTATEAVAHIAARRLSPDALMEACLARAGAREPVLRAMAFLDPVLARQGAAAARPGPLHGLPFGVKDVLDTAGMPAEYGSEIWRGHRPRADAAPVAWALAAGAVPFGKTVTTEFATRHPGPTTNPHNPAHTPGGSSSGSAAGVAAGYFPFGLGTQTAGSVIRPAAYCGVVGYKPSYGMIERHGMKVMSATLDTVGVLARSVADCALVAGALSGRDLRMPPPDTWRVGLCPAVPGAEADPATLALLHDVAARLGRAGATVQDVGLPSAFDSIPDAHQVVMQAESAQAMGWEMLFHRERLSPSLRERLEWGVSQPPAVLDAARATLHGARGRFAAVTEGLDVLLTPSAPGEAPIGLEWTGSPAFNLVWTSLHVPCITVPAGTGPAGLSLGVQLVGRLGEDARLLAAAEWVANVLADR